MTDNDESQGAPGEAEAKVDALRLHYFELFDLAPVAYVTVNEQGTIMEANLAAGTLLRVARDALASQPLSRFILLEDQDIYLLHRKRLHATHSSNQGPDCASQTFELRMLKKDGQVFWAHVEAALARDTDGSPICRAVLGDITERKHVEKARRESEAMFRGVIEQSIDGIFVSDEFGNIVIWNKAIESITGIRQFDAIGNPFWKIRVLLIPDELRTKESAKQLKKAFMEIIGQDTHWPGESREQTMLCADGTRKFVQDSSFIIKTHGTTLFGSIIRDITGRKRAEEELKDSERKYSTLVENAKDMIVRFDTDLRHVFVNSSVEQQLGISNDAILGKNLIEIGSPRENADFIDESLRKVLETDEPLEVEQDLPTPFGQKYFQTHIVPEHGTNGEIVSLLAITRDITGRKRAEEDLRLAQSRYQVLVENINDVIFSLDSTGNFLYVSPVITRISGYSGDELNGVPFAKFVLPQDLPELAAKFGQTLAGTKSAHEFRVLHKDGSIHWVRTSSNSEIEDGKPRGITGLMIDITDRKLADEKLQNALEENRNLLGELLHRAKNTFNMILGLIGFASGDDVSSDTREALEKLGERVKSVSQLYSLLYSSGSSSALRLDDYCARVASPLVGLSPNIALVTEMENVTVRAKTASPIGLIVTELIMNAIKHSFPGGCRGTITLALKKTSAGILLEVRNDGIGLPADSDFSGKTRMGLDLVRGLARQINGSFSMESGKSGTRCTVEFPLPNEAPE